MEIKTMRFITLANNSNTSKNHEMLLINYSFN